MERNILKRRLGPAGGDYEYINHSEKLELAGKRLHFIGIGGIGMSGLARIAHNNDAVVTGSDLVQNPTVNKLLNEGINVSIGHDREQVCEDTDAVVFSAAVKDTNPEFKKAVKSGVKVYKYAQMLGKLMDLYDGVAVCGTHGKSTTSGWLAHCMDCVEEPVNYIVGADINQLGSSSSTSESDWFVAEACEYDRSFLNLKPKIACILNIEQDHLDYYSDIDEITGAFSEFACNIRPGGTLVANGQDGNVRKVIEGLSPGIRCLTFGLDDSCSFYAENIETVAGFTEFDVYYNKNYLGRTRTALPGEHNILNALAVIAVGLTMDVEKSKIFRGLGKFNGIDRRLMLKGVVNDITVMDDYAHHPTEIRASLKAMGERYNPERLWCIFQPHQYSRTRFLLDDFAESFKLSDITILPEIYFVRDTEAEKKQINSQVLVDKINSNGSEAVFIDGFENITEHLKQNVKPGDLVVSMGAGDVWKVTDEYIQWLRENS